MTKEALGLRQVTQAYQKGHLILDGVSLSVPQGQFLSVIGPSGAGKTTLLRLFNGMVRPVSGEVWLDGQRFDNLKEKQRRKAQQQVGMIFQDFCLVEESSCLANVLNGSLCRVPFWRILLDRFPREEVERAREALEQVGLADYACKRAGELSGGQKQRVAIARVLVQQASIILADEPVASLDPGSSRDILELLRRLQEKERLTVVMNSHNVEQARQYSDRILGLRQGRVFYAGKPEEWTEDQFRELYRRQE